MVAVENNNATAKLTAADRIMIVHRTGWCYTIYQTGVNEGLMLIRDRSVFGSPWCDDPWHCLCRL
jgi:hypothetical protein